MRQAQAMAVLMEGHNVFLTGAPGAGKTYVLNEFVKNAKKAKKRVAVTASTGIAATHIGGTTIHSWAGIGIHDQLTPFDKKVLVGSTKFVKRFNSTDILVIDEVSMLHGARLDMVNEIAKLLRQSSEPYGGIQVVLVGDLFQLPPVMRSTDPDGDRAEQVMDFAHISAAWSELNPKICYLTEQHRQAGGDGLLEFLQAMRTGQLEQEHRKLITSRLQIQPDKDVAITRLYAHNVDVDALNQRQLALLEGESRIYKLETHGRQNKIEQLTKSLLAPEKLELKVGAEVMFVANDFSEGFVNGSRGQVVEFDEDDGFPIVELYDRERSIKVLPHSWTLEEDSRKVAEAVQLPLRLAWAITIHKSQGMSLDAAEVDLAKSFTPGMGYVALSRVRSLDGIYLRGINSMALQLHPDIHEFDVRLRKFSEELAAKTEDFAEEKATKESRIDPADEKLFAKLKTWRLKRAVAEGMPAYIVAHDKTLAAVAAHQPKTTQQLMGIPGFGPAKIAKYGTDILAITNLVTEK